MSTLRPGTERRCRSTFRGGRRRGAVPSSCSRRKRRPTAARIRARGSGSARVASRSGRMMACSVSFCGESVGRTGHRARKIFLWPPRPRLIERPHVHPLAAPAHLLRAAGGQRAGDAQPRRTPSGLQTTGELPFTAEDLEQAAGARLAMSAETGAAVVIVGPADEAGVQLRMGERRHGRPRRRARWAGGGARSSRSRSPSSRRRRPAPPRRANPRPPRPAPARPADRGSRGGDRCAGDLARRPLSAGADLRRARRLEGDGCHRAVHRDVRGGRDVPAADASR